MIEVTIQNTAFCGGNVNDIVVEVQPCGNECDTCHGHGGIFTLDDHGYEYFILCPEVMNRAATTAYLTGTGLVTQRIK